MQRRDFLMTAAVVPLFGAAGLGTAMTNRAAAQDAPVPIWRQLRRSRLDVPSGVEAPAGQNTAYIPVTADHVDLASFYVVADRAINASPATINVGGDQALYLSDTVYRWSPGDDLTHYIRVTLPQAAYADGQQIVYRFRVHGLGTDQKEFAVTLTFRDGAAHPDMPAQFHRPQRRLDLSQAARRNSFDPATLRHADSGFLPDGTPVWRSRLSHGHAQPGNGETGLYMNEETFPGQARSPISHDPEERALRLHTLAFARRDRPEYQGTRYRHQAAVIQGQTLDDLCGSEGVWRMVAKCPSRRYSWPAFWLLGRGPEGARGGWTQWPPEIDIMEHFNETWGEATGAPGFTTSWAQHYGPAGSNERVGAFGGEGDIRLLTGARTRTDEDYHSYACAVTWDGDDAEVTFFFDDVELGCATLFARHEDMTTRLAFYPIANVAVRAPGGYSAARYNEDVGGDMLIRDIGYYPTGHRFA